MRFDTQVIYPYPVLRPETSDYVDAQFFAKVTPSRDGDSSDTAVKIKVHYSLREPNLEKLISMGLASMAVIISCRDTFFRKTFVVSKDGEEFKLDPHHLTGKMEVVPVIYATKDINKFKSNNFSPDFDGVTFEVSAGGFLAYHDPIVFALGRDAFKPINSVFLLKKCDHLSGGLVEYDCENDHVHICLPSDMYDTVQTYRGQNTPEAQSVLLNTIYTTAVHVAVENLKANEDQDYAWAQVVLNSCASRNLRLDHYETYKIVQELLNFPVNDLVVNVINRSFLEY